MDDWMTIECARVAMRGRVPFANDSWGRTRRRVVVGVDARRRAGVGARGGDGRWTPRGDEGGFRESARD